MVNLWNVIRLVPDHYSAFVPKLVIAVAEKLLLVVVLSVLVEVRLVLSRCHGSDVIATIVVIGVCSGREKRFCFGGVVVFSLVVFVLMVDDVVCARGGKMVACNDGS
jgi:hypothetical protein